MTAVQNEMIPRNKIVTIFLHKRAKLRCENRIRFNGNSQNLAVRLQSALIRMWFETALVKR